MCPTTSQSWPKNSHSPCIFQLPQVCILLTEDNQTIRKKFHFWRPLVVNTLWLIFYFSERNFRNEIPYMNPDVHNDFLSTHIGKNSAITSSIDVCVLLNIYFLVKNDKGLYKNAVAQILVLRNTIRPRFSLVLPTFGEDTF